MAAAHLGTLPSTQQILLARQRAFTAKQGILTDSPPVSVQHLHLYDQRSGDELLPDISSVDLHCGDTAFSPCGSYLAVWLGAMQESRHSCHLVPIHDVVLYDISIVFQKVVRFCTGRLEPDLVWYRLGSCVWPRSWKYHPNIAAAVCQRLDSPQRTPLHSFKTPKRQPWSAPWARRHQNCFQVWGRGTAPTLFGLPAAGVCLCFLAVSSQDNRSLCPTVTSHTFLHIS